MNNYLFTKAMPSMPFPLKETVIKPTKWAIPEDSNQPIDDLPKMALEVAHICHTDDDGFLFTTMYVVSLHSGYFSKTSYPSLGKT